MIQNLSRKDNFVFTIICFSAVVNHAGMRRKNQVKL
jgi:hypothetical protein